MVGFINVPEKALSLLVIQNGWIFPEMIYFIFAIACHRSEPSRCDELYPYPFLTVDSLSLQIRGSLCSGVPPPDRWQKTVDSDSGYFQKMFFQYFLLISLINSESYGSIPESFKQPKKKNGDLKCVWKWIQAVLVQKKGNTLKISKGIHDCLRDGCNFLLFSN